MGIMGQWDSFNRGRGIEQIWHEEDTKRVSIPKAIQTLLLLTVFWYIFADLWIACDSAGSEVLS